MTAHETQGKQWATYLGFAVETILFLNSKDNIKAII